MTPSQTTKGLSLEVRLSAYIDGEVSESERREIDDIVACNMDARHILETLKAGNAVGNKTLDAILNDPVPLVLVRQIRQGPGVKSERVSAPAQRRPKRSFWPRLIAAGFVLLMIGGSTGYMIGKTSNDGISPVEVSASRTWLDDVGDAYRVYTRQQDHQVEVQSSKGDELVLWLARSSGVPFNLPDLADRGLLLQGGRIVVANGKPAAALMFKNEESENFVLYFLKGALVESDGKMVESIRDDLALMAWQKNGATYVFVGPSSDADIQQLAEAIIPRI